MNFDWSTVFTPIVAFLAALRAPVAALLLSASGCLATGCGPTTWNAKKVNTEMGTQFEIGYVSSSKVIIGFPGTVKATGNAAGEYEPKPEPMPAK